MIDSTRHVAGVKRGDVCDLVSAERRVQASTFSRELVGDDYGGIPASVIVVDAAPRQGPRLHKHAYAELFFVLEGEATFTDGTREHLVRGGEIVIVGRDKRARIRELR